MKFKTIVSFLLFFSAILNAAEWDSFSLRENGSLPVWLVAGPFPNEGYDEEHGKSCTGYFTDYLKRSGGESHTFPAEDDILHYEEMQAHWQSVISDTAGLLDFRNIFKVEPKTPGVAYAFTVLHAKQVQDVVLKIRSDDGVRVWLNSVFIHDHHVGRGVEDEEDSVPVTLRKGDNTLMVKVDQGDGGWGLQLRLGDPVDRSFKGFSNRVELKERLTGSIRQADFHYLPPLMNAEGGLRYEIAALIECGDVHDLSCRIKAPNWPEAKLFRPGDLSVGNHQLIFEVPEIAESGTVRIELETSLDHKTYDVDFSKAPYTELETAMYVDGLEEDFTIVHITDSHISIIDESEARYHKYSRRMDIAYLDIKHYQTGLRANPEEHFLRALWTAAKHQPDLFVLTGDIVNNPSVSSVTFVKSALDSTGIPYLYIAGNHDWHYEGLPGTMNALREEWIEKALKPLYNGRNPMYYQVEWKGINFIGIDNSTYQVSAEQLSFFKEQLDRDLPAILMVHIPVRKPEDLPEDRVTPSTAQFAELVHEAPNLTGILCGHIHTTAVDDISDHTKQVVTGLGADGHYRIIHFKSQK